MDIGNVASGSHDRTVFHGTSNYTTAEISQAQGIADVLLQNKYTSEENLKSEIGKSWEVEKSAIDQLLDDWFRLIKRTNKDKLFANRAFIENWVLEHIKTQQQTKTEKINHPK